MSASDRPTGGGTANQPRPTDIPTIAEAAKLIAARKLSPVELTEACLSRAEALDGRLHAFIRRTRDTALATARAAEARIMTAGPRGPLDGIPFAHKDIYCTAGIPTTGHSRVLQDHVPEADATTVAKLAEAGIVMLGKLATHEFAFGGPSFDLPWPPARNPWNPEHFTAGSSSGTGAAVASGMILGGTGSDTGGSIRGPAALCGIAGIKPTYGLCSRAGVLPLAQSLDHTGPMAWTAEDCALLLQAMAGHDPADPASADRPVPDFTAQLGQGVRGLRIGIIRHFHELDHPVSPATLKGIEDAAAFFRSEGATLRDVALPSLAEFNACGWIILLTEAFAVHEAWMRRDPNLYGELLRDRLVLGGLLSGADYMAAQKKRRALIAATVAATADVDILLTAAQPGEAARIDEVPKWAFMEKPNFTIPFNVTGWPGISICTGYGAGGLPVAMQLVGKPFTEPMLFRAADAYEKAHGWRARRPEMVP
ncbi:amidase [Siccirubricoccus deserti]|uniref:Amidase n=1 Tax=Siccirubricoccus deserti TaxID=2013562 RepID=A0A9X0QXE9_9PROT|nr:amidase [Siccirubricoccus deserti]MBC4015405.1 amidase [Siccirubricoccus deserti]GGC41384.1 amidase [Siccirubricoccus deserti]